jgi:hypothetical protein
VERKLRCVNFRRVSDPRREFLLAFTVTGSPDDNPGSTDDNPGSTDDNPGSTWERQQHVCEHLDSQ